jgi:hypothetical protein
LFAGVTVFLAFSFGGKKAAFCNFKFTLSFVLCENIGNIG